MQIGMVGLGKMGGNMRQRLRNAGHEVVGYDRNPEVSDVASLEELAAKLTDTPRVVWLMLPIAVVSDTISQLTPLLGAGDILIDGGNTKYTWDAVHAEQLAKDGLKFVDVGTSGGVWGLQNGYALMAGGDDADIATCMPIFDALKPEGDFGFVHAGGHGAGHFAKMVHNGIEYGLMQAYAEGWELLEKASEVTNVREVFRSWREGTVIRSWLLDLMVDAMDDDEHLERIEGYAADSGEGRWTVNAAVDLGVPVPTISAALFARFVSQQDDSPAMKMVAAMRNQFGGHAVKTDGGAEASAGGQGPAPAHAPGASPEPW